MADNFIRRKYRLEGVNFRLGVKLPGAVNGAERRGMARVFAYLMNDNVDLSAEAIFQDVSETISKALLDVCNGGSSGIKLTQSAFEIALRQIM